MYTAQITINRIQSLIKEKGLTQKNVLADCGINENTLKRMTDNKGISSFYLAKIADYLDCSVDYLLGRTNSPNGSYVNGDNSVQNVGNNSSVTITDTQKQDTLTDEFIEIFGELNFTEKVKVMNFVADMIKK